MKLRNVMIPAAACVALCALAAPVKRNVIDEVAWIVGDEPIFRSEIEDQYNVGLQTHLGADRPIVPLWAERSGIFD